jgi:hypothetical protein
MKRTPLTRTKPLRAAGPAKATVKLRKCAVCRTLFLPRSMTHKACAPECAEIVGKEKTAKDAAKAQREEKQQTRARKESLKTRTDYMKDAQHAFNRYVRLRDAGRPCICCGRHLQPFGVGGGFDAGHYRSVGSAPHLRFNPDNCHGQTKQCNRYGAGRAVDYRIGLINRIGIARVEALEADQTSPKWSDDDLMAIRDEYRAKWQQLERQQ